jgi:hypothetical protein
MGRMGHALGGLEYSTLKRIAQEVGGSGMDAGSPRSVSWTLDLFGDLDGQW